MYVVKIVYILSYLIIKLAIFNKMSNLWSAKLILKDVLVRQNIF